MHVHYLPMALSDLDNDKFFAEVLNYVNKTWEIRDLIFYKICKIITIKLEFL